MVGFAILPLLLVLLLCLLGIVVLWYRVLRRPRGGPLPSCGSCGYAVRGIETLVCPECGADLREVGIETPKRKGAVTPLGFVVSWIVLMPVPLMVLTGLLLAIGPVEYRGSSSVQLAPQSGVIPTIELRFHVLERTTGLAGGPGGGISTSSSSGGSAPSTLTVNFARPPRNEIRLSTLGPGGPPDLLVEVPAMRYRIGSGAWSEAGDFDEEAIVAWLNAAGVDVRDPAAAAEVAELTRAVETLGAGGTSIALQGFGSGGGSGSAWTTVPPGWWIGIVLGLDAFIFLAGLVLYFLIRRRRAEASLEVP